MSKHITTRKINGRKVRQYTPVVVYFGTFGIGFLSYVLGRIALGASPSRSLGLQCCRRGRRVLRRLALVSLAGRRDLRDILA